MAKTLATRMAFGHELIEIAKTNENFVVCNADTKACGLEKFGKDFRKENFPLESPSRTWWAEQPDWQPAVIKYFLRHLRYLHL